MKAFFRFYESTISKKIVSAVTGFLLFAFVFGHMLGNLKIFFGLDVKTGMYQLNYYAELLRSVGSDFVGRGTLLWGLRIGLSVCLVLHIVSAVQLWALNRKARPIPYKMRNYRSSTFAARAMFYGGLFLACFLVFHILHFTTGQAHVHGFVSGDVYSNVYRAFEHDWLILLYVAAVFFLALHLSHGLWSMFQTLGLDTPALNFRIRLFAKLIAVLVFFGFSCVPLAVYMGILPAPLSSMYAVQGDLERGGRSAWK